jgi:hypothetical protein
LLLSVIWTMMMMAGDGSELLAAQLPLLLRPLAPLLAPLLDAVAAARAEPTKALMQYGMSFVLCVPLLLLFCLTPRKRSAEARGVFLDPKADYRKA